MKFTVHSVARSPFTVKAMVGKSEVDAQIEGLVVELVSEDSSMTQTLRLYENVDHAEEVFTQDAEVTVTYSSLKKTA